MRCETHTIHYRPVSATVVVNLQLDFYFTYTRERPNHLRISNRHYASLSLTSSLRRLVLLTARPNIGFAYLVDFLI
jgi:hypothetical protein